MQSVAVGCVAGFLYVCGLAVAVGAAVLVLDGRCEASEKYAESYAFVVFLLVTHGVVACCLLTCCCFFTGKAVSYFV